MPSTYAHFQFGKKVQQELPEELQTIIEHHYSLYLIGLHGPDIFFYYHALFSHPINRMGFGMHKQQADSFFQNGLNVLANLPDPEAGLAYLLGFICHFTLDSECHGYIEYKIRQSGVTHTEIESDFDRQLLQDDGYQPERTCLASHIRPSAEDCEIIASFFPDLTKKQVAKSLKSMVFYNRLLFAPRKFKRLLILSLLRVTGNYREMHGLLIPLHPRMDCQDSTRELVRRSRNAVSVALRLCENYYNAYCEIDVLSERFQRTYGADNIEIEQYENLQQEYLPL